MIRLEDKHKIHNQQQHTRYYIYNNRYWFYLPYVLNTTVWPFLVGGSEEQLAKTLFLLRLQTNWKVHFNGKTDFSFKIRVFLRRTQNQIRCCGGKGRGVGWKVGYGTLTIWELGTSVSTSSLKSNTHPLKLSLYLTKRPKWYQRFVCCKGLQCLLLRI